jgi:hypothetical protein
LLLLQRRTYGGRDHTPAPMEYIREYNNAVRGMKRLSSSSVHLHAP